VRRNCLVAIGNTGGTADLPLLAGYLGHPDVLLRSHAAWAIGAVGGAGASSVLDAAAAEEPDETVREEIRSARIAASSAGP
jgi:epoxyqueuosine reductase